MPSLASLPNILSLLKRHLPRIAITGLALPLIVLPAYARAPLVNLGNATAAGEDASTAIFDNLSHNIFDISPLGSLYSLLSPFPSWSNHLTLLGAMGGLRTQMAKIGLVLAVQETSELFGNISGGFRRGAAYDGMTTAVLQLNTQRAFGWSGGTFQVSMEQIHGRNLSADNLGVYQTISGIEADRSTRLWELWFDQKFLPHHTLDIKIGQQSLDQEWMISNNALLFANTMFGWPMLPSADLPGGGPASPLASLGGRARYHVVKPLYIQAGIFSGSPAYARTGDAQKSNRSGTSFVLNRGIFAIAELQYARGELKHIASPEEATTLPYVYRLGGWYDSEPFADQYGDEHGIALSSPQSTGRARLHRGAFSLYAVMDQTLWHSHHNLSRALALFARVMGTPQSDRVPIDFSMNAGLTLKAPLPAHPYDVLGLGMGYTHTSHSLAQYDRAVQTHTNRYSPAQGSETFMELMYLGQMTGWLQLQPDFQYIFNPSGGIPNPLHPTRRIKNIAVFGLRANITL
ncbi:carbohydrate porin [Bombella sp. ESL0385]|uniref:carbohydrate porin n=1 Tax=Bombella sp. ESL0385 TaxID=2676446 RepID=UPI0012D95578|nr:carbohydrate porin [Bombella sp. ESL0385]MUG89486.1 carbohydrate porin [Bombella sp. ESL0385]